MKTNNPQGRAFVLIVGVYLIVKVIVNAIVGGGMNPGDLVFAIIMAGAMFTGLQYVNYAVALFLAITVLAHIGYNITHLPSSLLYLIEALIDIGCIALITAHKDVREHFTNKWTEIGQLFGK